MLEKLHLLVNLSIVFLVALVFVLALVKGAQVWKQRFPAASHLKTARRDNVNGISFGYALPGLVVYSPEAEEGHVAVFGGSGLGKTTSLLVPTLQKWHGSGLIIDISGDICKHVSSKNKVVFAPKDLNTIHYDVFADIDCLDPFDVDNALEHLAILLMPLPLDAEENAAFFIREGRRILRAALMAGYHNGLDFVTICEKITTLSYVNLFRYIDSLEYAPASALLTAFEDTSPKNTAGCKQACDEAVSAFYANAYIRNALRSTAYSGAAISASSVEECKVFICIPDEELEAMGPLLHLITAQTLEYISARSTEAKTQILVALDEFASLGKLEILPALRKARKRKTRIMILTQSLADLDLVYGKPEREAMLDNFAYKVILGAASSDSQEFFSRLIGKKDALKRSTTDEGGIFTSSKQTLTTERVPAIEPAALANLGKRLILLHPAGWVQLVKCPFYENPAKSALGFLSPKIG